MWNNVYIYGPLTLWFVAQLIKFSIHLVRGHGDVRYFFSSGGMPSAHATVVCSLATIALLDQGVASPIFGLAAIMAAIVMYDSFGVRRSSGEQAHVLNQLMTDLKASRVLHSNEDYRGLREILGHRPHEVFVGAILGIVGGVLFEWPKLNNEFHWLAAPLTTMQMRLFGFALVALLAIVIAKWGYLRSRFGKNKENKRKINRLLIYSLVGVGWLMLVLFSSYQRIMVVQSCAIALASWILVLGLLGWQVTSTYRQLKAKQTAANSSERRDKWLKKAKRK